MIRVCILLTGLLLCLVVHGQKPLRDDGAVVFETGFEEGNKNIWDDYDGNPDSENKIISNPGPFGTSGNHVIRLAVPAGQSGGSDLIKELPGEYDSLYARWYLEYEPGFNLNAKNHGGGLFAGSRNYLGQSDYRPDGENFMISTLEYDINTHRPQLYVYYRGMYQDCADPNGACWGDHFPCTSDEGQVYCTKPDDRDPPLPPVLTDGKWYCFEMKVKLGKPSADGSDANGELELWVNGAEYGSWKNLWMRTSSQLKLDILWLSLYHHDGSHSTAGVLIDDVAVSTLPIGSGITAVNQPVNINAKVSIYPNPTNHYLHIRFPGKNSYSVSLQNLAGHILINTSLYGSDASIDTNNLTGGMYFLTVRDEDNRMVGEVQKVICW